MPLSQDFDAKLPLASIQINRDRRQRREIDTKGLVDSIKKVGVLNPVIVTRELVLVAGERRCAASREAGLDSIPVRFADGLSPSELQIIELEENIKRQDLYWQDLVRGVGTIHQLFCDRDSGWTLAETAEECSLTTGTISMYLKVFAYLDDDAKVQAATSVREAYNLLGRRDQRAAGDALQELLDISNEPEPEAPLLAGVPLEGDLPAGTPSPLPRLPQESLAPARPRYSPAEESILCESFLHWAPNYKGKKFNLVHCDFPYGINVFAGPQGGAARAVGGGYEDTKDIYLALLECLCRNLNNFMSVSGHLLFWYSMKHHDATMRLFRELAPSLVFNPYPLIWTKSDNAGIASDASRTPRHVYETCLLASRGGRNIVKIAADSYSAPTDKRLHVSTKPEPMLKHFMQMLVDENTSLLDPTCGSAAALRAAEELGASRVLGMDVDEQCVGVARQALKNSRSLRSASREL